MSERPPIPDEVIERIRRAAGDPGSIVPRGRALIDEHEEAMSFWLARAVVEVLREWLSGRAVVELPEREHVERSYPESAGGIHQWTPAGVSLAAYLQRGAGRVDMEFGDFSIDWPADVARQVFAAGLAAADRAEQLAEKQANKDDPTGSGREPAARAPVQREGRAAGFENDVRSDGETYNAARDPNVGQELQRICDALGITAEQARAALLQRHEAILRDAEEVSS